MDFNLIIEAISLIKQEASEKAIARLEQFMILNSPKPKGTKVNIWDWVINPKDPQKQYTGVLYDTECGVAVATNLNVLLISHPDAIHEGPVRLIDKKGDELHYRPFMYKRVIPNKNYMIRKPVDVNKLAETLRMVNAKKRAKTAHCKAIKIADGFFISPKQAKLLLTLPEGDFYFAPDPDGSQSRPAFYESKNGEYTALFMPNRVEESLLGEEVIMVDIE